MRDIRFRAWSKKGKKMYFYSPFTMLVDGIEGNEFWKANYERFNTDFIEMQFTGLLDKNGKKIYEGDIVNAKIVDTEENYLTGFIRYSKCMWVIQNDNTLECVPLHKYYDFQLEVIGNIHKDEDLLNEKDK